MNAVACSKSELDYASSSFRSPFLVDRDSVSLLLKHENDPRKIHVEGSEENHDLDRVSLHKRSVGMAWIHVKLYRWNVAPFHIQLIPPIPDEISALIRDISISGPWQRSVSCVTYRSWAIRLAWYGKEETAGTI